MKPFDWPITNIFGTWNTPHHRCLNVSLPRIGPYFVILPSAIRSPPHPHSQVISMKIETLPNSVKFKKNDYCECRGEHIEGTFLKLDVNILGT
jgi:hypothetical protein